ncbi:MAG TPA: hypothetical protein VNZ49_12530 [Bacteroidia bacterium]|jgi:predicted TIM-barrel fold metal-dependent hydrolase|nr:hypothetical protein [Bacteroidia bacterium]
MPEIKNLDDHIKTIYNSHAHCFTIDHVPDYFAKGYFPVKISWLRKYGILKWLVANLPKIISWKAEMLQRLSNLVIYADEKTQEDVIKNLASYYPANAKFVLLTMDMEYMDAGDPPVKFKEQLKELEDLKIYSKELKDKIFPFIFIDPRRVTAKKEKESDFVGNEFVDKVKEYINNGTYTGLKLYPPIGYYPFDKGLKELYQFALDNQLPLITHCIKGVVHFRGDKKPEWTVHPVTGQNLPGDKAKDYANNLAHPLNFECLLNKKILRELWNDPTVDFSKLKICLGHFGGEDEWDDFLENPWIPDVGLTGDDSLIDIKHPWFKGEDFDTLYKTEKEKLEHTPFSWFSVVCKLITNPEYENVYADISYTLSDPKMYPLLKVVLESNETIRKRVLFGTDFYVVAKAGAERELCINLRGYLGEELFKQIAETNPREFLKNKLNQNV